MSSCLLEGIVICRTYIFLREGKDLEAGSRRAIPAGGEERFPRDPGTGRILCRICETLVTSSSERLDMRTREENAPVTKSLLSQQLSQSSLNWKLPAHSNPEQQH